MPQVTVRLTDSTLARLDALCAVRRVNRARLIRELIVSAVDGARVDPPDTPSADELLELLSERARAATWPRSGLHGIFKRGKRVWGLAENPASADLVERPNVTYTGEFDTFDADEIQRLLVAADDEQDAASTRPQPSPD